MEVEANLVLAETEEGGKKEMVRIKKIRNSRRSIKYYFNKVVL